MTDLRKAAEMALEFVEWLCGDDHSVKPKNNALKTREALRQALAQPEQEQYVTKVVAMHEDGTYTTERIPLPKREWVGLTDEEQDWCINGTAWVGEEQEVRIKIAEAIEAKLKEKNHG